MALVTLGSPVLRGPRLLLRPFRLTDVPGLLQAVEASWPGIRTTVPWSGTTRTPAAMRKKVRAEQAEWRAGVRRGYVIVSAADREILGTGMLGLRERAHATATAGYWLRADRRGRGYALEATILLCAYAFRRLRMHRVELWIGPENRASRRIPETLGFPLEGVLREHYRDVRGQQVSSCVYALLDREFRRRWPAWERRLRRYANRAGG